MGDSDNGSSCGNVFFNVKYSRGGPHCRYLLEKGGTVQKGGFTQAKTHKEKEQQMQAQGEQQS